MIFYIICSDTQAPDYPQQFISSAIRVSGECSQFKDMIICSVFWFINIVFSGWSQLVACPINSMIKTVEAFHTRVFFRLMFQFWYCYTVFSFILVLNLVESFPPNFCIFTILLFSYCSTYKSWVCLWSFGIMNTTQHLGYRLRALTHSHLLQSSPPPSQALILHMNF